MRSDSPSHGNDSGLSLRSGKNHCLTSQRTPAIRETRGNGTLLVLLDRSRAEWLHLPSILFSALAHFGMPYSVQDVSQAPLHADELLQHRAIVIAQEHFGEALRTSDLTEILRAVSQGVGLVNFDHDLPRYKPTYADTLGLASKGTRIGAAGCVNIASNSSFITWTRDPGEQVKFRRPTPACMVNLEGSARLQPLLFTEEHPALAVGRLGAGRVVQWLVSPTLWLPEVLGHVRGLDDIFWKGIVWAARKPFMMKALPPFVRIRLDDCKGYWQNATDFDFVDVLNEAGHIPNLGLCMRAVTADGGQRIKKLFDERQADFSPHTLAPDLSLFYGDESGEYTSRQLAEIMREMDELLARWRIRPSRVLSDHNHMWSERAIPFLLERGITFKMNVTCPGETWEGIHVDWRPAPYGQMDYVLDTIPGHPEFFVAFNHYPHLETARFSLPDGRFLFNRGGGFGEVKWDFLNGLTKTAVGRNDLARMARRYADHIRLGLDSLFFGGAISHTHFLRDLSIPELREVLQRAEGLTARHPKRYASYERIAEYARSKVETHLSQVDISPDGSEVSITVVGRATVPLDLYVFRDVDGGVEHRFETLGECEGVRQVQFAA